MRFPPSFLEEIKARLPVSEVVRHRVKLMRAGREWKGLSPFNAEKTPSFFVNDQKMAWFDHSAGKNGNIFDFLMETEGLSFPEAVKQLAHEAGLALPEASPEARQRKRRGRVCMRCWRSRRPIFRAQLAGRRGRALPAPISPGAVSMPRLQGRFQLRLRLARKIRFAGCARRQGNPAASDDRGGAFDPWRGHCGPL